MVGRRSGGCGELLSAEVSQRGAVDIDAVVGGAGGAEFVTGAAIDEWLTSWYESEPWRKAAPPFPERLIHAASDGTQVRSKSELVVLETLLGMGLRPRYEQRLASPSDPDDYRLPDFTVSFEGITFYWEHLGMLDVDSYARSWRAKRAWYQRNGFLDRLITSADAPGDGLSVPEVKVRAERRILRREPRQGEPGFDLSLGSGHLGRLPGLARQATSTLLGSPFLL